MLAQFTELCAARQWVGTPLADVEGDGVVEAAGAAPEAAAAAAAAAADTDAPHPGKECLVRREMDADDFIEIKVATAGQVDSGKCFGAGTIIRMHDGSVKAAESIVVGDRTQRAPQPWLA